MRSFVCLVAIATLLGGCAPSFSTPPRATSALLKARNGGAPAGYYAKAEGLNGPQLLTALHQTIAPHKDLGYDQARDLMFGEVDDLDGDDVVRCLYTGKRAPGVSDRSTASKASLNAEHTWPQSKGAVDRAKSDLHHLFPSDMETNSKRSSFPMGEVASLLWAAPDFGNLGDQSRLGNNAAGVTVFEPYDGEKGNVARALLYFYTCYGLGTGPSRPSLENFSVEWPTLVRWHQFDPVDATERGRNDAIFRAQGNRNPYIDRPEFVSQVGSFLQP